MYKVYRFNAYLIYDSRQIFRQVIISNGLFYFPSGLITTDMDPSNPYYGTNSSSVAAAILVPFFALILSGFAFYLYKHR